MADALKFLGYNRSRRFKFILEVSGGHHAVTPGPTEHPEGLDTASILHGKKRLGTIKEAEGWLDNCPCRERYEWHIAKLDSWFFKSI